MASRRNCVLLAILPGARPPAFPRGRDRSRIRGGVAGWLSVGFLSALPLAGLQTVGGEAVATQSLSVTASWGDAFLGARDPIELTLSRPLELEEGRVALFVDGVDVSGLSRLRERRLVYEPRVQALPRGTSEVRVFRVSEAEGWEELGRFPLRVRTAIGADQAALSPSLSVANKGQLAIGRAPDPGPNDRDTFQDLTGNLNAEASLQRGGGALKIEASVVGVSYEEEALRFRDLGEAAPRIDLSSYRLRAETSRTRVALGHVRQGNHPDLVRGHAARGLQVERDLPGGAHVAAALMHGSNVVGWRDLTGMREPDHRILTGQAGMDLLSGRPARLEVEATFLDGSKLARPSFNRGEVTDVESGRGYGVRLSGGSGGNRVRGEISLARSRFRNPVQPGVEVEVPEDRGEVFHGALRGDATAVLLRGLPLPRAMSGSVQATVRWGRVDPLYRSIGAFVRPDLEERALDLQANAGPFSAVVSLDRSRDNLDDIPSLLTTRTHRQGLRVTLPLRSLPGPEGRGVERPGALPALSYQFNQTHQFGANVPVDGGFAPSHIPDQMNDVHNLSLGWQGARWRIGARGGYTFQDNRQEGRDADDFRNVTTGISASVTPWSRGDFAVDLARERADNLGLDRTDLTTRASVATGVRLWSDAGLRLSWSPSRTLDRDDGRERRSATSNAEFSQRLRFEGAPGGPASGQAFLRYARQSAARIDPSLGVRERTRSWRVTSGLSLNLF